MFTTHPEIADTEVPLVATPISRMSIHPFASVSLVEHCQKPSD